MKIFSDHNEFVFGIKDIDLKWKETNPKSDFELIVRPNNTFLYNMTIIDETKGFEIIEANDEELEVFNKLIAF